MKKRTLIIILVVLVLILAAVFRLMSNKKKIDEAKQPKKVSAENVIPVYTATITGQSMDQNLIKTGTLIPIREADINAITGGRLTSVNFSLGSHVGEGGVVAKIDNQQVLLNIRSAELQRDQAKRDYDRYKALYEGDAAPQTNYQNAQLQYDNAQNQINVLQKQLTDFNIKAPISGMVISKLKEPGEYVSPGAVLGHIVDLSSLKANVKVSEADVYALKLGQAVYVTTDIYPGQKFDGKITFISAKGDATHNYDVEISLKNPAKTPLKAGTFVNVDFIRQSSENVTAIQRSALVESLKNPYVYLVVNGVVETRPIVVGKDFGSYVEVLDGLKEGDVVVVAGQVNLKPGMKVRSIDQQAAK